MRWGAFRVEWYSSLIILFHHSIKQPIMNKIFIFLLLISLFLLTSVHVNAQSKQKMDRVISLIEQSDFTKKLLIDKKNIETQIAEFKRRRDQLQISPEDIEEMKSNYDACKIKFDKVLDDIKSDFSKKRGRGDFLKEPNEHCEYFDDRYNVAIESYNDSCRKKIEAFTEADNGAFNPLLILTVIGIAGETFQILNGIKQSKIEASMEYFEKNYLKDKRLKPWEAL